MSKQTAVEYLLIKFNEYVKLFDIDENHLILLLQAIKTAKEMEKEQMWEYIKKNYCIGHKSLEFHRLEFDKYYNKTYKKEEK